MKTLSATRQWMRDHPNDVPCPRSPDAAAWRRKRGLDKAGIALRAKYEAKYQEAMRAKREAAKQRN